MNRLRYAFILACVFLGCAPVGEITKEEYKSVKESLTKDFRSAGYSGRLLYFWASVKQPGETRGRYFHLRIPLSTCFGYTLPRMALDCDRVEREAINSARKVCSQKRISFRSFNRAHERYGRLGMTYTEELRELHALLHQLKPQVKREFIERDVPLDFGKYDYIEHSFAEEDVLFRLDSAKLELAAWLAYDLGLGDAPVVVEIDENGHLLIDGEAVSIKDKIEPVTLDDPYRLVHIIPDPGVHCRELFEILNSLRKYDAQKVSFSARLYQPMFLKDPRFMHFYPAKENIDKMAVVEILGGSKIKLDGQIMELSTVDLDSLLRAAVEHSYLKYLAVSAHDSATCGEFINIGIVGRKLIDKVFFIREGHLPEGTPEM